MKTRGELGFFTVVEGNYGTFEGQRVEIVQDERIVARTELMNGEKSKYLID